VACPGDGVRWTETTTMMPAYQSGGYRAYRF